MNTRQYTAEDMMAAQLATRAPVLAYEEAKRVYMGGGMTQAEFDLIRNRRNAALDEFERVSNLYRGEAKGG
jgi:hypothetical protein